MLFILCCSQTGWKARSTGMVTSRSATSNARPNRRRCRSEWVQFQLAHIDVPVYIVIECRRHSSKVYSPLISALLSSDNLSLCYPVPPFAILAVQKELMGDAPSIPLTISFFECNALAETCLACRLMLLAGARLPMNAKFEHNIRHAPDHPLEEMGRYFCMMFSIFCREAWRAEKARRARIWTCSNKLPL